MNRKIFNLLIHVVGILCISPNLILAHSLVFNQTEKKIVVAQGQRYITFTYDFINKGLDVVKINNVELSCGCSRYELNKLVFSTGESGALHIIVDTKGKTGVTNVSAVIETDESTSLYMLRGDIEIPEYIDISPRMLMWRLNEEMNEKLFQITLNTPIQDRIKFSTENVFSKKGHFNIRIKSAPGSNLVFVYVRPKRNIKCSDMICVSPNPKDPSQNIDVIAYIGNTDNHL
jgi:hypothetical protein